MSAEPTVSNESWSTDPKSLGCHSLAGEGTLGEGTDPKLFGSVLSREDLRSIRGFYFILAQFDIELAKPTERVHHPPGQLDIYEETLKAGLGFSLHPFIIKLMKDYALNPSKIISNSW